MNNSIQFFVRRSPLPINLLLLGLFISTAHPCTAQEKNVTYSDQQWFQYYNQLKLSKKWVIMTDGSYRRKDSFNSTAQYLLRIGAGYRLSPDVSVASGYANLGFYKSEKVRLRENRTYQELVLTQKFSKFNLKHRFRIEERFFNTTSNSEIAGQKTFNFRFRYGFQASIPVLKLSSTDPGKKLLLQLGDEIMINAGHDIIYNVFDQNRVLIGPMIQFDDSFAVSLIYNHQFRGINLANTYGQDYVFWLGIRQKIDLTKK